MHIRDVEAVTKQLQAIGKLEKELSNLYETCAHIWKEDGDFWMSIKQDEDQHEKNLAKMAEIISRKPNSFEVNRPIQLVAIQTFISGIKETIERLRKNEIRKDKMLYLARDYEQSVLEKNYGEIVKTNDVEFQSLIRGINQQTFSHKERINKNIAELKAKS